MAAHAGPAGTFENAAGMATIARCVLVSSIKCEAGGEVVERVLCKRVRAREQDYNHENRTQQACRSELSLSVHRIRMTSSKDCAEWQRPQSKPNSPL